MTKQNIYRTHNCGQLTINDVNQNVVLSGWVNSIRKLGGIVFVTLRDHYGITQLVVNDEKLLEGINKEFVVKITGNVIERSSKNLKMATGEIEVVVDSLQVLGKCKNVLPFEISDAPNTKEELRFKYRYLDLRNVETHKILVKRAEMLHFVRNKMTDLGFLEVQTPILTASSPEGARDFLVPTITSPGEFYSLPQAPQQFKQLLMLSGYDKYFQIAPCFRNEAARADRTPGEFYQIDLEMSFATQEDVFEVCEDLAYSLFDKFTEFEVRNAPFQKIKYKDAMDKYCSDKPDLRNPLIVNDITNVFEGTEFNAFKDKTIKCIVANAVGKTRKFYDDLSKFIVSYEGKGMSWLKFDKGEFTGSIIKFLTDQNKTDLINQLNLQDGQSLFIIADELQRVRTLASFLRDKLGQELNLIDTNKVEFCWIVDFPFYEYNQEEDKIDFAHNPFSMPQGGLEVLENANPTDIVAYQYDLVCNGYEMLSGAVRNHDQQTMVKAFEIAGYDRQVVEDKFPALFNAFSYGACPHAGGAFGFDRMLMPILNQDLIRECIAFPLNKNGRDLLMNAPSQVPSQMLKDLFLKIEQKDKK